MRDKADLTWTTDVNGDQVEVRFSEYIDGCRMSPEAAVGIARQLHACARQARESRDAGKETDTGD